MSEIGIQSVSQRAQKEKQYREQLRGDAIEALEGYELSVGEYISLRVMATNQWFLPGDRVPSWEEIDKHRKGLAAS